MTMSSRIKKVKNLHEERLELLDGNDQKSLNSLVKVINRKRNSKDNLPSTYDTKYYYTNRLNDQAIPWTGEVVKNLIELRSVK